jgi:hypothetical protein
MAKRPVHTLSHAGGLDDVAIQTVSDGRTTVTEILQRIPTGWEKIGVGVAKRRKTDTNYPMYGIMLSAQRAFEDAAANLGVHLDAFEKMSHEERRANYR